MSAPMSEREYWRTLNKQRNLPLQYERARKRVKNIELELERYGLADLIEAGRKVRAHDALTDPQEVDRAIEREIAIAKMRNAGAGE